MTSAKTINEMIFILKSILEKSDGLIDDKSFQCLGCNSIEPLMLNLFKYIRQLDSNDVQIVDLKIKYCSLVLVMMEKREKLNLRQEMKFRNKLVEYVTDWIDIRYASTVPIQLMIQLPSELIIMMKELNQWAMKAVASLLKNLPIQPEGSDRPDHMDAKSSLFLKYFSLFLNILNVCTEPDSVYNMQFQFPSGHRALHHGGGGGGGHHYAYHNPLYQPLGPSGLLSHHHPFTTSQQQPQQQQPPPPQASSFLQQYYHDSHLQQQHQQLTTTQSAATFGQHLHQQHERHEFRTGSMVYEGTPKVNVELRNHTIQAMSNLLSANIDSGLVQSLGLGYHSDPQKRAAFMEVLTKVLQEGSGQFDMLAETVLHDRYEQLVQLVTMIGDSGELPIAMTLAQVISTSQMDELARVFVTIFDAKHLLPLLLWNIFNREVEACDSMQTLFRGNSLGSKVMAFCFQIYGKTYLKNLLEPLIKPLVTGTDDKCYEIDPSKIFSSSEMVMMDFHSTIENTLKENRNNMVDLTKTVLDAIISSVDSFPPQLRSMSHCLLQVLNKKFGKNGGGGVGGNGSPPGAPISGATSSSSSSSTSESASGPSGDQSSQGSSVQVKPSKNLKHVGTIVFLRFINPAIVSPFECGIIDQQITSSKIRRGLMLMSKILQNLANHIEFSKEQHMICFNDFLRGHFDQLNDWITEITSAEDEDPIYKKLTSFSDPHSMALSSVQPQQYSPNDGTSKTSTTTVSTSGSHAQTSSSSQPTTTTTCQQLPGQPPQHIMQPHPHPHQTGAFVSDANISSLHRLLWTHHEKMADYLATRGGISSSVTSVGRLPFDKMATLLAYLGPPVHKPFVESDWSSIDQTVMRGTQFEELMSKLQVHESDEFKMIQKQNIFYQSGQSKAGHPVFYFIARRYRFDETNGDLLIYHVMMTLKPFKSRPFDLVIDLTQTNADNQFRTEFLEKLFLLSPEIAYEKINNVLIINCNNWARDFTKTHDKKFLSLKNNRKLMFLDSLNHLKNYIELDQQNLPAGTLALEDDLKIWLNALRLSLNKDLKADIKVGRESISVTTTDKTKVLGQSVILNDIFMASQIEEVCLVDDTQFTLSIQSEPVPLSFIHSDCDSIVAAIIRMRTKYELSLHDSPSVTAKIRPEDVPRTLLNMALLNLGSTHKDLKNSAYNLLTCLTETFDLNIDPAALLERAASTPSSPEQSSIPTSPEEAATGQSSPPKIEPLVQHRLVQQQASSSSSSASKVIETPLVQESFSTHESETSTESSQHRQSPPIDPISSPPSTSRTTTTTTRPQDIIRKSKSSSTQ